GLLPCGVVHVQRGPAGVVQHRAGVVEDVVGVADDVARLGLQGKSHGLQAARRIAVGSGHQDQAAVAHGGVVEVDAHVHQGGQRQVVGKVQVPVQGTV